MHGDRNASQCNYSNESSEKHVSARPSTSSLHLSTVVLIMHARFLVCILCNSIGPAALQPVPMSFVCRCLEIKGSLLLAPSVAVLTIDVGRDPKAAIKALSRCVVTARATARH